MPHAYKLDYYLDRSRHLSGWYNSASHIFRRFVQFTNKTGGPQHLGVQLKQGGDIIAVSAVDSRIPNTLKKFLEGGDDLLKKAKR